MTKNDGFEFGPGGWLAMAAIFGMIAVCFAVFGCSLHLHLGEKHIQAWPPQRVEDASTNGASPDALDDWLNRS